MNNIERNNSETTVLKFVKEFFDTREAVIIEKYPVFLDKKELRYEIDVLVLDKELGLINIEVKGLFIKNIVGINGHYWKCIDFYSDIIKPFRQAENQLDSFVEKMFKQDVIKKHISKRIFVALPFVKENEWRSKKLNLTNSSSILFEDDFRFGTWVDKVKSICLHKAIPDIEANDYNSLYHLLKPSVFNEVEKEKAYYSKVFLVSEKQWFDTANTNLINSLNQGQRIF